jgi:hypothetical protein
MPSAPWQIPAAALDTEAVKTGVREIVGHRPKYYKRFQEDKTLRLPGFWTEGCIMSPASRETHKDRWHADRAQSLLDLDRQAVHADRMSV